MPPEDRAAARRRALRDVLLDARHRGAALHRAGARRRPPRSRRASTWTSCSPPAKAFAWPAAAALPSSSISSTASSNSGRSAAREDIRRAAIRDAEHWMLDRTRYSDGLGAIYPVHDVLHHGARCARLSRDHPDLVDAIAQFDRLLIETDDRFYFQPCVSPVWDTAIAMFALGEMGDSSEPARRAMTARRRLDARKEVRRKGDWSRQAARTRAFRLGLRIRQRVLPRYRRHRHGAARPACTPKPPTPEAQAACERRAINWLLAMQSERRRLGGLRRRQQLGRSEPGALRRPQRHARSHLPRHHRARARSPVPPRLRRRPPRHPPRRPSISSPHRKRTEAGTAAGASITSTARSWPCAVCAPRGFADGRRRHSQGRALAASPSRIPTAAGAKVAPATPATASCPRPVRRRKPPGRSSALLAAGDTPSPACFAAASNS